MRLTRKARLRGRLCRPAGLAGGRPARVTLALGSHFDRGGGSAKQKNNSAANAAGDLTAGAADASCRRPVEIAPRKIPRGIFCSRRSRLSSRAPRVPRAERHSRFRAVNFGVEARVDARFRSVGRIRSNVSDYSKRSSAAVSSLCRSANHVKFPSERAALPSVHNISVRLPSAGSAADALQAFIPRAEDIALV
jgi:hypothetical protein